MEEILATISIALAATIFIVLSFSIYLTIRIFTGKSINDKEYSPVHATIFDLFFHNNELYEYQTEIARKKPTYRFLSPGQSDIFTADPRNVEHILKTRFDNYSKGDNSRENLGDLLGHGIFTVDGEKWKQQRKLASFEFSTRVLRDFSCSVFRTNACKLVRFVSEFALSGKSFDAQDMLMRYALESIFKVGFGKELKCLDEFSKEGEEFMEAFDEDKFVYKLITTKREELATGQNTAVREDILSRYLVESERDPEKMNDKYLRDIILNFMVAGKDTAAASLSWFLYMLCKNPLVQERIVQEIRDVTSSHERTTDVNGFAQSISEEALNQMQYLHAALSETLRLYPIVPLGGPRICLGKDFAYRQMKIVSMVLLHFFRFKLADEKSNVRYKRMLTLHIEGGLHLHAIPRTST
ncbi:hypothetical protein Rs2_45675 [Raphanus sativus]|nr:hypothetical protein Rs2_45675 [Raphanus sativus]